MTEGELRIYWQAAQEAWPKLAGWALEIDRRAKSRGGQCRYRARTIGISAWILAAPEEEALDVLLHEIAHALVDPAAGHGPEWKRMAAKIGARPKRCYGREVAACQPPKPWAITCPNCGPIGSRHRRKDLTFSFCRGCGEETSGQLRWERREKEECHV